MDVNSSERTTPRRRFLRRAATIAAGLAAAVGAVGYFFPGLRRWARLGGGHPYQAVAAIDGLPAGQWKLISFEVDEPDADKKTRRKRSAWVRRGDRPAAIRVLSPVCPHAGCQINWRPEKSAFVCPCHGGTFDPEGRLKSGPPRRSMDALDFRVEGGQLLVRWENFNS